MLTAAYRIAPPELDHGMPAELSLCGTLLIQAGLAAAQDGNEGAAGELIDEAAGMAERVGDGYDHHRTGFGPTAVDLARAAAGVEVGDARAAIAWHEEGHRQAGWRGLPAEHRAAHLVDAPAPIYRPTTRATRPDLMRRDPGASRDRRRPAGRDVLAQVVREPTAPATLVHLAAALGVG